MPEDRYQSFTRYARRPPKSLRQFVLRILGRRPTRTRRDIYRILRPLRRHIRSFNGPSPRTIQRSRLVPVDNIWRTKQRSCGAMATLVTSVFRNLGLSVKLVDGWMGEKQESRRHAWNEIYVPSERRFVAFDLTRKGLRPWKIARKRCYCADWSEIITSVR